VFSLFHYLYTFKWRKRGTANGVFEKWDKQDIKIITDSSIQPASSLHPPPQQYLGQRLSRGRIALSSKKILFFF
jgi:hypothetical protein